MSCLIAELPWLPPAPPNFAARCKRIGADSHNAGLEIQSLASFRLDSRQSLSLARAVARCRSMGSDLSPLSDFRLGVLASATFDLLLDCIPAAAARHGVASELVTVPYDQVMQQALDPASDINAGSLDAALVAVDHRWLHLDHADAAGQTEAAVQRLRTVVEGVRRHGNAPAILQTLAMPPHTLFGSYDRRVSSTMRTLIDEANRMIVSLAQETGSYLLDVASLAERVGTDRWFDPVQWVSYKMPFAAAYGPVYADFLGRLLGAIRGKTRKCLVLDLDNTIWGGVVGDDGIEGIKLGQGSPLGEAFLSVQQAALELRDRGIMLAVCSKNDDAVARGAFREHPDMVLRENHISVFQANWTDKGSNLEAIAKQLNIGLDALVLLDDNPAERAQVRAALPMVAVPELPIDPSWFAWSLAAAGYFEAVSFSEEDRLRADAYAADAKRAEVLSTTRDLGDYLTSLEMTITYAPFDSRGRQRIAQLINKTNQFNLTTRRYTEAEVAEMEMDKNLVTLQVRLEDRFGDLGMIGVVMCRARAGQRDSWEIDTWLMSCRVLGRQVEQAMLAKVVAAVRARGAQHLVGTYIPTAKNHMVSDHYNKLGFEPDGESQGGTTTWKLSVRDYIVPTLPMRINDKSTVLQQVAE